MRAGGGRGLVRLAAGCNAKHHVRQKPRKSPATYRVRSSFSCLDSAKAGDIYGRHMLTVRRRSAPISWHNGSRQFFTGLVLWSQPEVGSLAAECPTGNKPRLKSLESWKLRKRPTGSGLGIKAQFCCALLALHCTQIRYELLLTLYILTLCILRRGCAGRKKS